MYKIMLGETELTTVNTPVWVKKQDNGCFALTDQETAQGVVVGETVYHLSGKDDIPGTKTVVLGEISETAYQQEQKKILSGKAEQADVDAIAAAIERGLSL